MPSPLIDRISIAQEAQKPWPKDVKLFQPYEVEQILLPDNANCLAVQAFLKMCNLDFQVEPRANAEAMSPTGKVPFIKAGRFVTAELEGIVQFVNGKGKSLTDKLDNEQKSNLRAYMTLVRNVIEIAELYMCWVDKETYDEVTSVRHGSVYPWPLNHFQNREKRKQIVKKLKLVDWHNKSLQEVHQEVELCCEALSVRLDNKSYFFVDSPTELDALVFGHLFTILTTPLPRNDLAKIVRRYPSLINLVKKIETQYFKKDAKLQ
ncbi:metaxin-2-like [Euwallacea similis]|uniref:metaxin-2-like n=1 Tax=Euwallacea similis TaxID=1736056 RepID=UPI00344D0ACA